MRLVEPEKTGVQSANNCRSAWWIRRNARVSSATCGIEKHREGAISISNGRPSVRRSAPRPPIARRHSLQRRNLSKEILLRLSRCAEHLGTGGQVRHDAGLRSNLGSVPDSKMSGHRRLPTDTDEILKHR